MSETPETVARGRIDEARRTGANQLSLSDLGLSAVPLEVWELTNLRDLWLNGNDLKVLSPKIGQLSNLRDLGLGQNKLNDLPSEIGKLQALERLVLNRNTISNLPPEFSNLQSLRILDLNDNPVSKFPDVIFHFPNLKVLIISRTGLSGELVGIRSLTQLQKLDISGNSFANLPIEITFLTGLIELSAHSNKIRGVPPEIGRLTRLKKLFLNINDLHILPPDIGALIELQTLYLNKNYLESLPAEIGKLTSLKELNLRGNRLITLPAEIGKLRELKVLPLRGNEITSLPKEFSRIEKINSVSLSYPEKLTFPPADIARLGGNAIIRYLRAVDRGEEVVLESKLLLVGEGAVGKTWLYEALNGRIRGGNKAGVGATVGIEIGPLILNHSSGNGIQMRLNCWDFAGQDITHATHQFFFSERTLFIVCWNARAGWEAGKLRKWLTNIRDRGPGARVLLVATHADQQHSDYPEKELRAEFEQIVGTFKVSSHTGEGIPTLREAIARLAEELPMMGLRWPADWRAAQQAVLRMRLTCPYNTMRKVHEAMCACGLALDDATVLLSWLHELGEVLHYADVPELADVVMLDPQWVTRQVGAVLASPEVQEARGILTRQCLSGLWPEVDDYVRQHLLGMMERFDLAYRIPDVPDYRCLVVERLQQDMAEYEVIWDKFVGQPEVRLRYRLKAMHPGIPTWFIARCHRFTLGLHWLRGVLFGDNRQAPRHLALIIASDSERTVDFTVRGPQPWTFLPLLTDGFEDTIRKRYPGLEIERIAPCPGKRKDGTPCDFEFAVSDLEALRWPQDMDHDPEFEIRCTRCRTKHQIDTLLLGLSRAPSRDAAKLEEILDAVRVEGGKTRAHLTIEMDEARRFFQLAFVDEWNKAQELEEQSCPIVFALYPVDGKTLTRKSKLRLQLYCMNPGCWHSIGPDGMYEFQPRRDGLVTAVRWVRTGLRWLRPAAMLLPSGSQLAGEYTKELHEFAEHAANELKFTADVFKELKEIPDIDTDESAQLDRELSPTDQSEKMGLHELKVFLDELKFPVKPYGGLKRVRTPEGHILWLCAQHAAEFTRSP
jgi:Leucine-rich repeat (LRR) protein/GTPase SAR1 family protein